MQKRRHGVQTVDVWQGRFFPLPPDTQPSIFSKIIEAFKNNELVARAPTVRRLSGHIDHHHSSSAGLLDKSAFIHKFLGFSIVVGFSCQLFSTSDGSVQWNWSTLDSLIELDHPLSAALLDSSTLIITCIYFTDSYSFLPIFIDHSKFSFVSYVVGSVLLIWSYFFIRFYRVLPNFGLFYSIEMPSVDLFNVFLRFRCFFFILAKFKLYWILLAPFPG